MSVSVVVRSKDEADRLRLTLASLARQTMPAEIVVVNDGSSDHTRSVLAQAAADMPLKVVTHAVPRGRSGASNAGARVATGDLLIFLDGDTLAAPEMVAGHAAAHVHGEPRIGRGGRFHLRCTRFLLDPETGTPRPGEEARVARMSESERARSMVTRAQVLGDFEAIERRAEAGVYPGAGPRRLEELELDALRHHRDLSVLWAAVCGANFSVRRDLFLQVGGFDDDLHINEHRELALRLCLAGARMCPVEEARAYHLTHRVGWRDPLEDPQWEALFYAAHPQPAVKLLAVFWASLTPNHGIPPGSRILSLPELEIAARGESGVDYDAVRRLIGVSPGPAAAAPETGGARRDTGASAV